MIHRKAHAWGITGHTASLAIRPLFPNCCAELPPFWIGIGLRISLRLAHSGCGPLAILASIAIPGELSTAKAYPLKFHGTSQCFLGGTAPQPAASSRPPAASHLPPRCIGPQVRAQRCAIRCRMVACLIPGSYPPRWAGAIHRCIQLARFGIFLCHHAIRTPYAAGRQVEAVEPE